jgi:hypothetical protein
MEDMVMNASRYFIAPLAFVPLLVAVNSAVASVPPYRVEGVITGKATLSVTGSCSVAPVSAPDASFGAVYDSTNEFQGLGILASDGKLLALVADSGPRSITTDYRGDISQNVVYKGFINITGDSLYQYMDENSCPVTTLIPLAKSNFLLTTGSAGVGLSIDAQFTGYQDYSSKCATDAVKTICHAGKVNGRITFKAAN